MFLTNSGIRERDNKQENQKRRKRSHPPLNNYPATCKCTSSRIGKEVTNSEELSVIADPLAGGENQKTHLGLCHLSYSFSKQSYSCYRQLVFPLQM